MIHYLRKVKRDVFRVSLSSGPVNIKVTCREDSEALARLIKASPRLIGLNMNDLEREVARVCDLADILDKYDKHASNEWVKREVGDVKAAIQLALGMFIHHDTTTACRLYERLDVEPTVAINVFVTREEYEEWCKQHEGETTIAPD